jgi:hypothetical protein
MKTIQNIMEGYLIKNIVDYGVFVTLVFRLEELLMSCDLQRMENEIA